MAKKIRRPYIINGAQCWISGNTEQEVLDNAIRLMGLTSAPAPAKPRRNFGQYTKNWYEKYSKPTVSTATATTYERQLRLYILPALGDKNVEDITLDDVQSLFNGIEGAKETKVKCKNVPNMIFKLAVEEGLMARNLLESGSFRLKGEASKETKPYTVEEMRRIVEGIGGLENRNDRAYLALHSLHPLRLKALGMGEPEEYIVGGVRPLSYTQVRKMCRRIAREIGFEGSITPMRFRTTVLTDIYEQTGDIKLTQHAAGHATPEMTLKHYVKGRRKANDAAQVIDRIYATPSGGSSAPRLMRRLTKQKARKASKIKASRA